MDAVKQFNQEVNDYSRTKGLVILGPDPRVFEALI